MIIAEGIKKFKEIEKKIYKEVCNLGIELLLRIIEDMDRQVMESRDKRKYRHKGIAKSVVKTVMGELEYERRVYISKEAIEGKRSHYLLDEEMGLEGIIGKMSENLSEAIIEAVCEEPYRKATERISELSNQGMSTMGVWNVTQAMGVRVEKEEKAAAARAKKHGGTGEVERKVLFEENDGVYLSLQGESRKKHGEHGELKVGIAYSGARQTGTERYNLADKVAYATFGSSTEFHAGKEGVIAGYFNVDEIEQRIINADGAVWARGDIGENMHYQLDPYHRNRAIGRYVADDEKRAELRELLYGNEIDKLLKTIAGYADGTANDEAKRDEHENYVKLLTYYTNNKDRLIPYNQRDDLNLPEPPGDIVYRNLGAMESNIFSLVGRRMKHRRANWSIRGANHLAKLLTLKGTDRLAHTLNKIHNSTIADDFAAQINAGLSAAKIPSRIGKGWNGFLQGSIPNSLTWLRDFCQIKGFN